MQLPPEKRHLAPFPLTLLVLSSGDVIYVSKRHSAATHTSKKSAMQFSLLAIGAKRRRE